MNGQNCQNNLYIVHCKLLVLFDSSPTVFTDLRVTFLTKKFIRLEKILISIVMFLLMYKFVNFIRSVFVFKTAAAALSQHTAGLPQAANASPDPIFRSKLLFINLCITEDILKVI